MATKNDFSLIRGRRMRVTRLNGCGVPVDTAGNTSTAVTEGFISVGFTAQTTEAEEILITNASGGTCARDPGSPSFNGYQLEITFCGVQPCIFEILTGQEPVEDAAGETVGFKMNTKVDVSASAFALEIWAGVPGVACDPGGGTGSFGYILVPFVSPGVVGDFTIENGAVNFVVNGASTKDGNAWGVGRYDVVPDLAGTGADRLPAPLDPDDHLYVVWTSVEPPAATDGCVELPPEVLVAVDGVNPGAPGSFTPPGATLPKSLTALRADEAVGSSAQANEDPWPIGNRVLIGDNSEASWNGNNWVAGRAAAITGVTVGAPGVFTPTASSLPLNLAALKAHSAVGDSGSNKPGAPWTSGKYVTLADASKAHWTGSAWASGSA